MLSENPRSLRFNRILTFLTISAKEINDLKSNYNKIGLLQAFYRFLGFHSIDHNIFLLHGSALIYNNKAVLFADNGHSTKKTLPSLELAFISKEYIADEFLFLDLNSFEIFSDDNIPIHIRQEARNHFVQHHNINTTKEFLLKQSLRFKFIKRRKLDFIFYVNFSNNKEGIKKLPHRVAAKYAMITLSAHLKKMLNPSLDRFQFITQQDNNFVKDEKRNIIIRRGIFKKVRLKLARASVKIARSVLSFELFVQNPCNIRKYIDTIIGENITSD